MMVTGAQQKHNTVPAGVGDEEEKYIQYSGVYNYYSGD